MAAPTSGGRRWTSGSCRLQRGDGWRRLGPGTSGGGVAARREEGWRRVGRRGGGMWGEAALLGR
jgi:hypothetical protein